MKNKNIRLSPKHGINPSITVCPLCGKDVGLALHGILKGDAEAPKHILDNAPCETCCNELDSYKDIGFIVLVASNDALNHRDISPWQFFKFLHVIKNEAAERLAKNLKNADISQGVAWMIESEANAIGLFNPKNKKERH